MEIMKVKCPVCGCEEFILLDNPPYKCGMETYIEDYTKYYGCKDCGLVLRFAKDHVDRIVMNAYLETEPGKKRISLEKRLDELKISLNVLNNRKNRIKEEQKDDSRSIERDRKNKEELKEIEQKIRQLHSEIDGVEKELAPLHP